MNATLTIGSTSGAIAPNQAPAITSAVTKSEKSATAAIFTRMRPSLWRAALILQGFAGILAALYLLAASAFFAALLFYTFIR
jgi:hypothetical protein